MAPSFHSSHEPDPHTKAYRMHATTTTIAPATTMKTPDFRAVLNRSPMLAAAIMAVLFSLVLFALLYGAIHAGKFVAEEREALQTIDFVRLKRDSEVETLSRRKPPPLGLLRCER